MTIWQTLGIPQTTDQKEIKKAYAARVKSCHREEKPEEWAVLHDAYQRAIQYAKRQEKESDLNGSRTVPSPVKPVAREGADDAYWMLQDNVMQLQWKQEPSPATAQLEEWGRKYVVYNGQYDVVFDSGSKEASEEDKITKLWSQTLPALLMAPSEEEFDTLFEEFIEKRDELGYTDVMEKKTAYMNSAKEKLGIQ